MVSKIKITEPVHHLFKAFYEHNLPNKKELCEELRHLIKAKLVNGKYTIEELWNDRHALCDECSELLFDAIKIVTDIHVENIETRINVYDDHENDDILPADDVDHKPVYKKIQNRIIKHVCDNLTITVHSIERFPESSSYVSLAIANLKLCINILNTVFEI